MDLRDYLLKVAHTYDRASPMSSEAQVLLRSAADHLAGAVPAGLLVTGSGGLGTPTLTPWVGFFDPDETTNATEGLYLVYLFSEDLHSVTLMLQQGVTRLREELRTQGRLSEFHGVLRKRAENIRISLSEPVLQGWSPNANLGSQGSRQRSYEAGNIAAVRYPISNLPSEQELRADLWHLANIYQQAILLNNASPLSLDARRETPPTGTHAGADPLREFRPKDSSDYVANIAARQLRKQRRHETLIAEYGTAVKASGFDPATNVHPQDLILHRNGQSWLIEAKVVYTGNATVAVRDAVGQLLTYHHFLHPGPLRPRLVGLFTEPIGPGYVEFLQTLDIASVWKTPGGWNGSHRAFTQGIVPSTGSS